MVTVVKFCSRNTGPAFEIIFDSIDVYIDMYFVTLVCATMWRLKQCPPPAARASPWRPPSLLVMTRMRWQSCQKGRESTDGIEVWSSLSAGGESVPPMSDLNPCDKQQLRDKSEKHTTHNKTTRYNAIPQDTTQDNATQDTTKRSDGVHSNAYTKQGQHATRQCRA